jgi:hypothetical protein
MVGMSVSGGKGRLLPTIREVIALNETTIEAVGAMLDCGSGCARDSYLLVLMALIVFKVLGWYAAAATRCGVAAADDSLACAGSHSEMAVGGPESPVVTSYALDDEDAARMAAQSVLSELHRVQRLVNRLSVRLQGTTSSDGPVAAAKEGPGRDYEETSRAEGPFSAIIPDQLGLDLRKRLKALSLGIVEKLRRE